MSGGLPAGHDRRHCAVAATVGSQRSRARGCGLTVLLPVTRKKLRPRRKCPHRKLAADPCFVRVCGRFLSKQSRAPLTPPLAPPPDRHPCGGVWWVDQLPEDLFFEGFGPGPGAGPPPDAGASSEGAVGRTPILRCIYSFFIFFSSTVFTNLRKVWHLGPHFGTLLLSHEVPQTKFPPCF